MIYQKHKLFDKRALWLWALISIILLAACKSQNVTTYWASNPVKTDGEMDDWSGSPMVYFEETGLQLGLRNGSENLYLLFRFSNQSWARAIHLGGITIWLDSSGKKKKDLGIRYNGGPAFPDSQRMRPSNEGGFEETLTPEQQQRLSDLQRGRREELVWIDKKDNNEKALPPDGTDGPAAGFSSARDTYTYEFSIPLSRLDASPYGIGAKPGQTIALGFEWGGATSTGNRQHNMRERPEGPPGGGEGSWGGGPPGGGRGGREGGWGGRSGQGSRPQTTEKQEVWIKTKLAVSSTP
jgi:hypothetical protein